jgi:hypothetical protein
MLLAEPPLVDIAMSLLVEDHADGFPSQCDAFFRAVVTSFCFHGLSIEECKSRLAPFLKSTRSIDRLYDIIHCPEEPLPSGPLTAAERKRRPNSWTAAEDNRLLCAMHRFGTRSWPVIAAFVGNNRTRSQCAQRWRRGLDPRISKAEWSAADDLKFANLVALHGQDGWTAVSQRMGNRSDVQCRYRYLQLKRAGIARERSPPSARPPDSPPSGAAPFARLVVTPLTDVEHERALPKEDENNSPPHRSLSESAAEPICPAEALIDWNQSEEGTGLIMWSV